MTPKRLTRKPSSSMDDGSPTATGMKASFHHSFLDYSSIPSQDREASCSGDRIAYRWLGRIDVYSSQDSMTLPTFFLEGDINTLMADHK